MHSLFQCPLCGGCLERTPGRYVCPQGHSFDCAAQGYTHLLPANRKHSKAPGDDKEMVAARWAFLERGYYAPLRKALEDAVAQVCGPLPSPTLLDAGCGEGYYTAGMYQALSAQGKTPRVAGVDISKYAVKRAARRLPEGEFGVASVYHLPVASASVDVVTNVFSPLCVEEYVRVLKPGGWFFYVVPSARHLWQMKQVLYDAPYENRERREDYPGFTWMGATPLRFSIHLNNSGDIMALLGMTPYAWKTPKAGLARLAALDTLETEIGFDLHRYKKD